MYDSVEDCEDPNADPPNPPKPLVGSRPLLACDLKVFLLMFADSWCFVYYDVGGSRNCWMSGEDADAMRRGVYERARRPCNIISRRRSKDGVFVRSQLQS